jgi:hypothetical protein
MTIAETWCAAKFILRIKVEITRLAAGTNEITVYNRGPESSDISPFIYLKLF